MNCQVLDDLFNLNTTQHLDNLFVTIEDGSMMLMHMIFHSSLFFFLMDYDKILHHVVIDVRNV